jgi:hypothetical protein
LAINVTFMKFKSKSGRVRELLINSEKASASPIFEENVERFSCIRFSITHGHDPKSLYLGMMSTETVR